MLCYNILKERSSLETTLTFGLSDRVAEQPRLAISSDNSTSRSHRVTCTLVGSLLLHLLAVFAILDFGPASRPLSSVAIEVEASLQFTGNDDGQPQPQATPVAPDRVEPSLAPEPSPTAVKTLPLPTVEPLLAMAEPIPQVASPVLPAPAVQSPPILEQIPVPLPEPVPAENLALPVQPTARESPVPPIPAQKPKPKVVAQQPPPIATATALKPALVRPRTVSPTPPSASVGSAALAAAASNPPPVTTPGPEVTAGWRGAMSAWLQSHKTYPDEARQKGEEGSALVKFTVDRGGRVLEFALVRGTGSASLDAAVGRMLTGAQLPAFPAAMTQDQTTVTVQIRYALQ